MRFTDLQRKFRSLDPLVADGIMALALAALALLQVYGFLHLGPFVPPHAGDAGRALRFEQGPRPPEWISYLLVAGSFLPLMFRRKVPWLALSLTGVSSIIYTSLPSPPAFTNLGPMIALYTLAATSRRRHTGVIALLVAAVVLAMPTLAYSRTRWVVEAGGAFALLAAAALLGDTARNRRLYIAEVEQRAIDAERTREEEALRRVDEERLRIAREVHDIVAHSLSIVAVQAAAADALVDTDPARAHDSLGHIRATSKQALSELRSMLGVLRTGDSAPLQPAADLSRLDTLLAHIRDTGLEVTLHADAPLDAVPAHLSLSAYRIVQESLTNVVRHARATHASVTLALRTDELVIDVVDDGLGAAAYDSGSGHGLQGMYERVAALGGTFEAAPAEKGFRVHAVLPTTREAS